MDERLQALAHYVIYRRHPSELGKTKLAKAIVAADVMMYRRSGKTVSGANSVIKMQHGPVPVRFFEAIAALKNAGKVVERLTPTPAGTRKEYIWLQEPDIGAFTGDEISTLERAADHICRNFTAVGISEATHDALWEETPIGQAIPIEAIATFPGEITPEIMAWAEGKSA